MPQQRLRVGAEESLAELEDDSGAAELAEAAGQMPVDVGPELAQDQDGQGGCADPVRVVVAVNADAPALGDGGANRLTRSGHVPEAERVVRRQRSLEEPARAGHIFVATPDEHGRRRRAERELTSERRDGVALTWFDRPGALVHGQSTLGSAPDGTRA